MNFSSKHFLIALVGVFFITSLVLTKGFGLLSQSASTDLQTIQTKTLGNVGQPSPTPKSNSISDEYFKIPLSDISTKAKWFTYNYEGVDIRFFALKASDGSIKTAFDACDICYPSKKGYRQEGNYMVCNNCGTRFLIDSLGRENKRGGGCWPGYLPSFTSDNFLLIKKSDLENGKWRFS
ncbi:MAG: DUF2318 domain-containing protein [Candidatus Anstonellaceae archaeon]